MAPSTVAPEGRLRRSGRIAQRLAENKVPDYLLPPSMKKKPAPKKPKPKPADAVSSRTRSAVAKTAASRSKTAAKAKGGDKKAPAKKASSSRPSSTKAKTTEETAPANNGESSTVNTKKALANTTKNGQKGAGPTKSTAKSTTASGSKAKPAKVMKPPSNARQSTKSKSKSKSTSSSSSSSSRSVPFEERVLQEIGHVQDPSNISPLRLASSPSPQTTPSPTPRAQEPSPAESDSDAPPPPFTVREDTPSTLRADSPSRTSIRPASVRSPTAGPSNPRPQRRYRLDENGEQMTDDSSSEGEMFSPPFPTRRRDAALQDESDGDREDQFSPPFPKRRRLDENGESMVDASSSTASDSTLREGAPQQFQGQDYNPSTPPPPQRLHPTAAADPRRTTVGPPIEGLVTGPVEEQAVSVEGRTDSAICSAAETLVAGSTMRPASEEHQPAFNPAADSPADGSFRPYVMASVEGGNTMEWTSIHRAAWAAMRRVGSLGSSVAGAAPSSTQGSPSVAVTSKPRSEEASVEAEAEHQ